MRINREIIRLSVPAILSNITVPLLGLCDTAIAGHLGADSYIGAIAVGSMMINVTFWLFGFLRMGTTGITAQAFGANDSGALRTVFSRAVMLGAAIGILLIALMYPLRETLLALISPEDPIRGLASRYYTIVLMSAPALLATNAVQGWLFGMQTTLIPMIVAIATNVINIATSLTLVLVFHTGFIGVAVGTLAANWLGLMLALVLARRKAGGKLWIPLRDIFGDREGLGRFFRVNSDIFFRSAAIMAVSLGITAIGSRLGALTLAVNAVMMQFFNFFSFFMDGLAFTAEALTGRFAGARDFPMLRRSRNALLWWSAAMAALFFLIYFFASDPIVALITDSPTVRSDIRNYHLWLSLIPPLTVAAFIFDGFYIGLTATRAMLVATVISALVFFGICFIHADGIALPDNGRLWTAFLVYLAGRGAILAAISPRVFSPSYITASDKTA